MATLPEVCTEDVPLPSRSRAALEVSRKKGIRIYLVLFVLQLVIGLACVVCSVLAVKYEASKVGIPYYTGGVMIAVLMLFSSMLAFRVYNKGPAFSVDDAAKDDVTCALNCHHTCSFFLLFGTVVGLALLWMYGLCLGDDGTVCSYGDANVAENKIIAGVSCVFGLAALATSGVGICLIRKFGQAFGLEAYARHRRNSSRRDNSRLRRTSRMQNVFSLPESGNTTFTIISSEGYTNLGFDPPSSLPPYSPTAQEPEVNMTPPYSPSAHVQLNHVAFEFPEGPPPPYCEVSSTDVTLEGNTPL